MSIRKILQPYKWSMRDMSDRVHCMYLWYASGMFSVQFRLLPVEFNLLALRPFMHHVLRCSNLHKLYLTFGT